MLNRPPDEDNDESLFQVTARAYSAPAETARLFMIAPMRTLVLVLNLEPPAIRRIQAENQLGRPCELFGSWRGQKDTMPGTVYTVMYHAKAWQLYGDAE